MRSSDIRAIANKAPFAEHETFGERIDEVLAKLESRRQESLKGLQDFLCIPSISTKPEHQADVVRCANWLADQLRSCNLIVEVARTPGHPVVLARNEHKPNRPTILFYGHYDVQPPEPLDRWTSPPFEPTVRKTATGTDAMYGRGAADDKGQVWCHVEAIRAWQELPGGLPVNLTLLIEGEEEVGSRNLDDFINIRRADLKADIALISDTDQFDRGVPGITYGLRGVLYMEVFLTAADHDLHSGMFGGAVPNPANALCELLSTLHDAQTRRVNIPGFYDDVVDPSPREREEFARLPFDEQRFRSSLNVTDLVGEVGFTTLERRWVRPACDINGLTAGYQGPGAKTVIASKASCKVSMRLVPYQNPEKIEAAFKEALIKRCPNGVKIEFARHTSSPGIVVPLSSRPIQLAAAAIERGFGRTPVYMREGGSIPVVGLIKEQLGIDTILIGFGLPDDCIHSANEKFDLEDSFFAGMRTAAALYDQLGHLWT